MHLIEIAATNHRRLELFHKHLKPGENMHVAGDTGTGKTTATNIFWDILTRSPDSIRHGKSRSILNITLAGEDGRVIRATRKTTKSSSTVTFVEDDGTAKGKPISSKEFNKMISQLAVNPHLIAAMGPTEQVRTLAAAADLGDVDLGELDYNIQQDEDLRLTASRRADAVAPGERPAKVAAIDVADLVAKKDEAEEFNRDREAGVLELNQTVSTGESNAARIETLEAEILELKETNDGLRATATSLTKKLKDNPALDTSAYTEQINAAAETNAKAALWTQWKDANARHEAAVDEHTAAGDRVKAHREAKKEALDGAVWPLPGLSIEDGQVIYKGSLLSNLGNSEQQLVCAAIAMKDILAHAIHLVRLDGIESMSRENFETLLQLFNGHGIQVFSTRVARDGAEAGELVIVDGEYVDTAE